MRELLRLLLVATCALGLFGGPVLAEENPSGEEADKIPLPEQKENPEKPGPEKTAPENTAPKNKPPLELDEAFVMPEGVVDEPFDDPLANLPKTGSPPADEDLGMSDLDKLELRWSGRLQTDLRFRLNSKSTGAFYDRSDNTFYTKDDLEKGIARNENIFKFKLDAVYGRFAGVVDLDFVYLGYPGEIETVADMTRRDTLEPFYLQAHAMYVEATDLFFDGLDLRIGQQLIQWGMADQFNPTNNLNSTDLEDILLFGEQQANLAIRADYNPWDSLVMSGVLVPIFRPALTPRTAPLALAATDRAPFGPTSLRHKIHAEQGFTQSLGWPTAVRNVHAEQPATTPENMQFAFRLAYTLGGQDLALSYYRGRHDFPQPVANDTYQEMRPFCDRDDPDSCIQGLLTTDVSLAYPRMQVIGFNMAGEIPLDWIWSRLGGLGYRLEAGVYLPERVNMRMRQHNITLMGFTEDGEYDYNADGAEGGPLPLVIDDTPFAKWTVGLDYSFGPHVMLVAMWVHGMSNEFGAGDFMSEGWAVRRGGVAAQTPEELSQVEQCVFNARLRQTLGLPPEEDCGNLYADEVLRPKIGDFAVIGLDFKFLEDRGLFRLFVIWELSGYFHDYYDETEGRRVRKYMDLFGEGASAILFPEFNYNFGNGFELGLGALLQFGENFTTFGDPAAGGHLVWSRARFSW